MELRHARRGAAGAAAGGAPSASASFNQGVILWNANKFAEAKSSFEAAVKADPNMAEAHYWLGMALLNGGDTAKRQAEVRDVSEAGADRPVRRHGEVHRRVD